MLRSLAIIISLTLTLSTFTPVQARQLRPLLDELAAPLTESELSGVGCLIGSSVVAGSLVYLLGGFGAVATNLSGELAATRVLEGAAAGAFIFSSACYVGSALAPVVARAYEIVTTTITDELPATSDPIPSSLTDVLP